MVKALMWAAALVAAFVHFPPSLAAQAVRTAVLLLAVCGIIYFTGSLLAIPAPGFLHARDL